MFNLGFHFFTNLQFAEVWFWCLYLCLEVEEFFPVQRLLYHSSLVAKTKPYRTNSWCVDKFESLSYKYLFSFLLQIMNYKREETS